jgi:hypothetical protein
MRLGSLIQKLPGKIPQRLWKKISEEVDAVQGAAAGQVDAGPGAVLDEANAAPRALPDEVDAMSGAVPHEEAAGVGSDLLIDTEGVERQSADEVRSTEGDAAEDEGDEGGGGSLADLFAGMEVEEEETGLVLLIASLPDCPTQELLEDAKRVEALVRQRKRH